MLNLLKPGALPNTEGVSPGALDKLLISLFLSVPAIKDFRHDHYPGLKKIFFLKLTK